MRATNDDFRLAWKLISNWIKIEHISFVSNREDNFRSCCCCCIPTSKFRVAVVQSKSISNGVCVSVFAFVLGSDTQFQLFVINLWFIYFGHSVFNLDKGSPHLSFLEATKTMPMESIEFSVFPLNNISKRNYEFFIHKIPWQCVDDDDDDDDDGDNLKEEMRTKFIISVLKSNRTHLFHIKLHRNRAQ